MSTLAEIHRRIDAAGGDDPRAAPIAVRKLINDDVRWLERRAVDLARRELWSWVRISRLLMRSRQSVRERFGPLAGQFTHEFESDDPIAALNAAAEITLQRFRDAYAARIARDEAMKEASTTAREHDGSAVGGHS
jgi:hypothetical protein